MLHLGVVQTKCGKYVLESIPRDREEAAQVPVAASAENPSQRGSGSTIRTRGDGKGWGGNITEFLFPMP